MSFPPANNKKTLADNKGFSQKSIKIYLDFLEFELALQAADLVEELDLQEVVFLAEEQDFLLLEQLESCSTAIDQKYSS